MERTANFSPLVFGGTEDFFNVYVLFPLGMEHNFAKYRQDEVTDFGVPYDYGSVMHYRATAFSKDGNRTIVALKVTMRLWK